MSVLLNVIIIIFLQYVAHGHRGRKNWQSFESSDSEFITYSSTDIFCDGDGNNICTNKGHSSNNRPGVSVFDCNNDGNDDVLFAAARPEDKTKLFINIDNGNAFNESAQLRGLSTSQVATSALTIDIDNDGWIDIIFSHRTYLLQVFRNTGDCNFIDITQTAVPFISVLHSVHGQGDLGLSHGVGGVLSAGDYDHDGDLDIIAGSLGFAFPMLPYPSSGSVILWTNQYNDDGSIVFIPALHQPIIPTSVELACTISFEDFDEDGWDDIIVSMCNDAGPSETLLWKNSPYSVFDPTTIGNAFYDSKRIFVDVSNQIKPFGFYGNRGLSMTHTFGDFNADNHVDIFMSDMGSKFDADATVTNLMIAKTLNSYPLSKSPFSTPTRFFISNFKRNGKIEYEELATYIGVDTEQTGWAGLMVDLDNDGWDDLIHQGNFINMRQANNPGFVYKNIAIANEHSKKKLKRKVKLMTTLSLQSQETIGMAYGDFNNDGFVDIAINSLPVMAQKFAPTPIYIFQNSQLTCNNNNNCDSNGIVRNYLDIELRGNGVDTNYYGVNVLVRVLIEELKYNRVGKIRSGTNWASSNANYVHFGIPIKVKDCSDMVNYDKYAATVYVYWKGMDENYVQSFTNIQLNQRILFSQINE